MIPERRNDANGLQRATPVTAPAMSVLLTRMETIFADYGRYQDPERRRHAQAEYADALRVYTVEQVNAAITVFRDDPFMAGKWPEAAHLLRILGAKRPKLPKTEDSLDAAAWEHIEEQLHRSPADRSVRELLPHQRRAFSRVTGGFRSRGGFGKEEANEARNWPFLKRRFLQICAESPATPEDLLPPVEPVRLTLEQMLAAEKEHDAKQAAREAAEDARRATWEAVPVPAEPRSAPKRPGGVQRPRMSDAEVARRTMDLAEFTTRLEAERVAFACCSGCIMPGSEDGMEPSCAEAGNCEREARAARGVG